MKITILTLFPQLVAELKNYSIIKRAIAKSKLQLEIINFRDYSKLSNQSVDDTCYGGGAGMVIRLEPLVAALKEVKTKNSMTYLMSPQGELITQERAKSWSNNIDHLILICGHYEGIDARIKRYIDGEISIGDFVVSGGEIPAMIVVDMVTRLIPGVINHSSLSSESFEDGLLDHDVYTKPESYEGDRVPPVLLSGNHKLVDQWNLESRISNTKHKRPDLYAKYLNNKGE